jgi:hypothetical protein
MLPLAARVRKPEIDKFYIVVLERLEYILGGLHVLPSLPETDPLFLKLSVLGRGEEN